jgi:hypothetical protein
MLLFVLDPSQRPAQPPFPPSIKFLKSRHCRGKTTSGPRVHGEVDKHRPEPSRPSIIPIPKFDTYAEPRVESLNLPLALPVARRYVAPKPRNYIQ